MLSTQVRKSKKSLKFQMSINRTKITKIFLNNNINIKEIFQVSIMVSELFILNHFTRTKVQNKLYKYISI